MVNISEDVIQLLFFFKQVHKLIEISEDQKSTKTNTCVLFVFKSLDENFGL